MHPQPFVCMTQFFFKAAHTDLALFSFKCGLLGLYNKPQEQNRGRAEASHGIVGHICPSISLRAGFVLSCRLDSC